MERRKLLKWFTRRYFLFLKVFAFWCSIGPIIVFLFIISLRLLNCQIAFAQLHLVFSECPISEFFVLKIGLFFSFRLWKHVLRKGDVVIDATCGNGHDTLALLRMVADETGGGGCVYAMDIQKVALESTSVLLSQSLSPVEVIETLIYFML